MPSAFAQGLLRATLKASLRSLAKPMLGPPVPVAVQRRWVAMLSATAGLPAKSVKRSTGVLGGAPAERLMPESGAQRTILYLHGGAFCVGSPATHRALTTQLARAAQAAVEVLDYRLAPEHPHPAAVDDALGAYRALLNEGVPAAHITIAGDSAGGALTLMTAVAARDAGLPLPAALVLLSPLTDFDARGATMQTHAARDPMLRKAWLDRANVWLRGSGPPLVSPLDLDLHGLPPMLIQAGSEEILLSDAERLAERARSAGVEATLKIWPGLWHVFQLHAGLLDASDQALADVATFIRARESAPQESATARE